MFAGTAWLQQCGGQLAGLAEELVEKHKLYYAHILTDYDTANQFYTQVTDMQLMGTPSYILYDKDNKLVGVNPNSIDIEALDLFFSD